MTKFYLCIYVRLRFCLVAEKIVENRSFFFFFFKFGLIILTVKRVLVFNRKDQLGTQNSLSETCGQTIERTWFELIYSVYLLDFELINYPLCWILEFFCSGWAQREWEEQCDRCNAFCIWKESQTGVLCIWVFFSFFIW